MFGNDSDETSVDNIFVLEHKNKILQPRNTNNCNKTTVRNVSHLNMPQNSKAKLYSNGRCMQGNKQYRGTSPVRSIPDLQPHKFNSSICGSFQRCVSPPISEATSTGTISALEIASAFKNFSFNREEKRIISRAYNENIKSKICKRRTRKKKYKSFLRKSEDSGEDGSNSSISSDDCKSIRSERLHNRTKNFEDCRSLKSDLISRTIRNNNMFLDRTQKFKQHALRNMFALERNSRNDVTQRKSNCIPLSNHRDNLRNPLNSFVFNKNNTNLPILEEMTETNEQCLNKQLSKSINSINANLIDSDSDDSNDDLVKIDNAVNLFKGKQTHEQLISCSKNIRTLNHSDKDILINNDLNEEILPLHKNVKDKVVTNSNSQIMKPLPLKHNKLSDDKGENTNNKAKDFVFAKPLIPVPKSANIKNQDKIICSTTNNIIQNKSQTNTEENSDISITSTSDSTKSSFMRRKLFTQTLDVTESKENNNNECLTPDSPLTNIYCSAAGDKNKLKKSLIAKSYLTRDILQENHKSDQANLLELVHKIVPVEHINMTSALNNKIINQTNNHEISVKTNNTDANTNNNGWDINTIISTGDCDNLSDTFTDDENIFQFKNSEIDNNKIENDIKLPKTCQINLSRCDRLVYHSTCSGTKKNSLKKNDNNANAIGDKLYAKTNICDDIINTNFRKNNSLRLGVKKKNQRRNITKCANTFWDTDVENDYDSTINESVIGNKISPEKDKNCKEIIAVPNENERSVEISSYSNLKNKNKSVNNFEDELDALFKKNPKLYMNHITKIIKEKKMLSMMSPKSNELIENINKCFNESSMMTNKRSRTRKNEKSLINTSKSTNKSNKFPQKPDLSLQPTTNTNKLDSSSRSQIDNVIVEKKTNGKTLIKKMDLRNKDKGNINNKKKISLSNANKENIVNNKKNNLPTKNKVIHCDSINDSSMHCKRGNTKINSDNGTNSTNRKRGKNSKNTSTILHLENNNGNKIQNKNASLDTLNFTYFTRSIAKSLNSTINTDHENSIEIPKRTKISKPDKSLNNNVPNNLKTNKDCVKSSKSDVCLNKAVGNNYQKSNKIKVDTKLRNKSKNESIKATRTQSRPSKRKFDVTIDSPTSVKSFRSVRVPSRYIENNDSKKSKQNNFIKKPVKELNSRKYTSLRKSNGLGFTKPTIGIMPRHYKKQDDLMPIDDDCKSMTVISTASTSLLNKTRKTRFLHVF